MVRVELREMVDDDLEIFYLHQCDSVATMMAAFTSTDAGDRPAFDDHWRNIRWLRSVTIRTILADGEVAGHILTHVMGGAREVSYWLGQEFWGKGIATAALEAFLQIIAVRPLTGRAVADNVASIRVLEKNGFVKIGEDTFFANARGVNATEVIYRLEWFEN